MQTLATVAKPIRKGSSVWDFIKDNDTYFATNGKRTINVIDINELRGLYSRMIGYGYSNVSF